MYTVWLIASSGSHSGGIGVFLRDAAVPHYLKGQNANPTSAMPEGGRNGAQGQRTGPAHFGRTQTTSLLKEVVNHA
jgi:hypothetical protein